MPTGSPSTAVRPAGRGAPAGMTVLVADKFEPAGIAELQAVGCRVHIDADLVDDSLTAAIVEHDPDVLVVRSTKVRAADLAQGGRWCTPAAALHYRYYACERSVTEWAPPRGSRSVWRRERVVGVASIGPHGTGKPRFATW